MLARLWRREIEAAVEQPLAIPRKQPLQVVLERPPEMALLESPQAPGLDSRKSRRRKRRKPLAAPLARIWLRDRETPPAPIPTPRDHAARLLHWVRTSGYAGKVIPAMDLEKIYPVMCEEVDWQAYRWQPVAVELRKLTGNRKLYRWINGDRRRVYYI